MILTWIRAYETQACTWFVIKSKGSVKHLYKKRKFGCLIVEPCPTGNTTVLSSKDRVINDHLQGAGGPLHLGHGGGVGVVHIKINISRFLELQPTGNSK